MLVEKSYVGPRTFYLFQFFHHYPLFLFDQFLIFLSHFVAMDTCCPFEPRLKIKRLIAAQL